jgi:hypothetical protein
MFRYCLLVRLWPAARARPARRTGCGGTGTKEPFWTSLVWLGLQNGFWLLPRPARSAPGSRYGQSRRLVHAPSVRW